MRHTYHTSLVYGFGPDHGRRCDGPCGLILYVEDAPIERLAIVQIAKGKGEIAIRALHDSTVEGLDAEEDRVLLNEFGAHEEENSSL